MCQKQARKWLIVNSVMSTARGRRALIAEQLGQRNRKKLVGHVLDRLQREQCRRQLDYFNLYVQKEIRNKYFLEY